MKKILQKKLDTDTESIALGSLVSVLIAFAVKSIVLAVPLGLAFALAHKHALSKKKKSSKK